MPNWLKNIVSPTGKAALLGLVAATFPLLSAFGVQIPAAVPGSVTAFLVAALVLVSVSTGGTMLHRSTPPQKKRANLTPVAIIFVLTGCGFFNSPAGKVVECSAATAANALAALCPMPATPFCLALSETAYEEACQAAASSGADQEHARKAGVSAARNSLDKLSKRGVKLSGDSK